MKILKTFEAFSCSEDSKCKDIKKVTEIEEEDNEKVDLETLNKDSNLKQNLIETI
jgi:hypothetical protein